MKKRINKLEKSQIAFLVLVLASAFLLIINFLPTFRINAGLSTEFTEELSQDYSVYVNQSAPDKNFADSQYYSFVIGNSCETYLNFNLEFFPEETNQLFLYIKFYDLYDFYHDTWDHNPADDVEINIILIEESWNASELTWNNKPEHGEIIDTVNVSDILQGPFIDHYNLQKAVDLTELYKIDGLKEINLCINITKNNQQLNTTSVLLSPRLLGNFEKVILSYINIISTSIIITMLIGTIYYLRKNVSTCPSCGAKKVHTKTSCSKCENVFEKDQIIKRSDYQLILILVWAFTFFEVFYLLITTIDIWLIYELPIFSPILAVIWFIICVLIIRKKIKLYKKLKGQNRN
ncbi:MAG: DNRLRE domain-containing protein [Promethearchaeota archaeon]|jgi:hypothetical protein